MGGWRAGGRSPATYQVQVECWQSDKRHVPSLNGHVWLLTDRYHLKVKDRNITCPTRETVVIFRTESFSNMSHFKRMKPHTNFTTDTTIIMISNLEIRGATVTLLDNNSPYWLPHFCRLSFCISRPSRDLFFCVRCEREELFSRPVKLYWLPQSTVWADSTSPLQLQRGTGLGISLPYAIKPASIIVEPLQWLYYSL